jgi:hypothetical protein
VVGAVDVGPGPHQALDNVLNQGSIL